MPVTKSAIKKLRRDRVREAQRDERRAMLRDTLRKVRKQSISLDSAFSVVDKSAKLRLIHDNKADRLKSRISRFLAAPQKKSTSSRSKTSASASK